MRRLRFIAVFGDWVIAGNCEKVVGRMNRKIHNGEFVETLKSN